MPLVTQQDINARLLDPADKQMELDKLSSQNGIVAFATGGQTNATNLTNHFNRVTTVATIADSVKLPPAVFGTLPVYVVNATANSMNVFPQTGDAINLLSANTAFAQAAGIARMYICFVTGNWTAF
jgi:hypothetical protein